MTRRAEKIKQLRLAQAANHEGRKEQQMTALRAFLELCSPSELRQIDSAITRIAAEETAR